MTTGLEPLPKQLYSLFALFIKGKAKSTRATETKTWLDPQTEYWAAHMLFLSGQLWDCVAPSDVEKPLCAHVWPGRMCWQPTVWAGTVAAQRRCCCLEHRASRHDVCTLCIPRGYAELGKLAVLTEQLKIATFPWRHGLWNIVWEIQYFCQAVSFCVSLASALISKTCS